MKLKDKVIIVTGAGQGIGRAIALRFAQEGASQVIVDINRTTVEETGKLLKEIETPFTSVSGDVLQAKGCGGSGCHSPPCLWNG